MNRRAFLASLALGAGAVKLAPILKLIPATPAVVPMTGLATSGSFRVGDIITFCGKFARNPITGKPTDYLQQFVVTAETESGFDLKPFSS